MEGRRKEASEGAQNVRNPEQKSQRNMLLARFRSVRLRSPNPVRYGYGRCATRRSMIFHALYVSFFTAHATVRSASSTPCLPSPRRGERGRG